MINILQAVFLGIIQGITEWLPVSSSGHLVIVQNLFGLGSEVMFNLWLHIATLVVIFIVFWKDIIIILRAFLKWDCKSREFKWGLFIIIANIPVVILGYFFRAYVIKAFSSILVVSLALLFTGTLLFFSNCKDQSRTLGYKSSLVIGIFQGLAIFPGVSRSGATISAGLLQGISREEAVRFSFLMAIPAFIGAAVLNAGEATLELISIPYIIGFATALIAGYFSLKLLLRIVKQGKLHYFTYYCWALGIVLLIFF